MPETPLIDLVTTRDECGNRRWDFDALRRLSRERGVPVNVVIRDALHSCGDCLEKMRARGAFMSPPERR
jgi:hypothetical protein